MEDGHSGMSFGVTVGILKRLLDGKPLTAIEDISENWNKNGVGHHNDFSMQCIRCPSLFKIEHYNDGSVTYSDNDRVRCYLKEGSSESNFLSGLAQKIVDERFPITMPYFPDTIPYKVEVEEFLTDRMNGDFDTVAIYNIRKPSGEIVPVNRYFKEDRDSEDPFVEIGLDEFELRKNLHQCRIEIEELNSAEDDI